MRNDKRENNQLRPIKFTHNYTKHALGSILVEFGDTKVIVTASVDNKKPKWMSDEDNRGWVTAEYSLLPASTNTTRTASICGGFLALKDAVEKLISEGKLAENPIIEPIAAISIGIVDGEIKLDLNYEEDSHAQVDSNVILTKSGKIVDFQTTSEGEPYEFERMIELFNTAKQGINKIIEMY